MGFFCPITRSAFSFLFGTFTPEELVLRAKELGHQAVALTDRNGLYGSVRLFKAARKLGLKAVFGAEVTLNDRSHITLLVKNKTGYRNLCRLLTRAHLSNKRGKPALDLEELKKYAEGLVCICGRFSRPVHFVSAGKYSEAKAYLLRLLEGFGRENLYLGLENNFLPEDEIFLEKIPKLARELSLPVIPVNEVAYLRPEDYEIHKALVGVARAFHHLPVEPLPNESFYLLSEAELKARIPMPEAFDELKRLLTRLNFSFELGKIRPPKLEPEEKSFKRLARILIKNLARDKKPVPCAYLFRLDKELSVIKARKLANFFLLVKEIKDFADEQGIRCTVRGSAAGSLIVHLLLGGVDPVKHRLLFERFLNDGRMDLPDVDLDFDSDRRDEVLSYVFQRFGEQAALLATVLTFRVRGAVRMIGRALGYPYEELSRLARALPSALRGVTLEEALLRFPELEKHPILKEEKLLRLSMAVAGLPFRVSVHLGGVILAPEPVGHLSPLERSLKGYPVIQFDKDDVEALGLLKLDLLGLRMHTAIRKTIETLKKQKVKLDLAKIPLDDRKTYRLLQEGDTLGVFQLESPGQRQLVVKLRPRRFADIIAEISLFRPGPVEGDMVTPYVRRRNGLAKVVYPHPDLKPILEETYGVVLFQEQVLEIAHRFSGMSYAEADAFRRAMTRDRSPQEMARLKERFISGALRKGYTLEVAERVFEMVSAFAAYGFCKAHAASFAHLTYQSAYLKAHYPREFYLGLLNAGHVGSYPPFVILNEARRRGIPVYPPHVNRSGLEYLPEGKGIRLPLTQVRLLGPKTSNKIIEEREKNGPYTCITDFLARLSVPRRTFEMLLLAGAFAGLPLEERKVA